MARDATFVLAHLSDLHLGPLPPPRLAELAGKRVLGYLNWQRRRHMLHRTEVIDLILADLQSHGPDHVAVTGDLVNIALPAEFTAARQQLQRVGLPDRVTFVPGNHDAYVRSAMHQPLRHWGDYMRGDKETAAPHFPFVRRRGPLALIGLSSAVPTAPFMATGTLGPQQLSKLAQTLDTLGREQMFRVVLIHHPPVSMPKDRWKRLTDAPAFRRIIAEHGAELILHGHDHVRSIVWIDGPKRKIPAIGVPSASATSTADHDPAAYNLYRLSGSPSDWHCEMISRGLRPGHEGIIELERIVLIGG